MDGTIEDKVFAPGYGEFRAQVVSLDEIPGRVARRRSEDWIAISATLRTMTDAWQQYQATGVPERLDVQMSDALDALSASVDARDPQGARQAAIGVARASFDFELRYRPIADVDLDRLALWGNQLQLDLTAEDAALVLGDVAVLEAIWDRVDHAVSTTGAVDAALAVLRDAADAEDMAMVGDALATFRAALQG